jgi:hypothetical protein
MKKTLLVCICLYLNAGFAQGFKVDLQEVQTLDKVFTGSIDEKYDITAYLKFHDLSIDNLGIYSVKGWYYYNKVQKKIPLVGVYDGQGLTLFSFKLKENRDKVTGMEYSGSVWDVLDSIKTMPGFDERFDTFTGEWTDGKKKLKFKFYDPDLDIYKNYQLLNLTDNSETKSVNLNEIIQYHSDFELAGYLKNQSGIRILLKYEHLSRLNVQGMCGAGMEIGYIILVYDKDLNLEKIEETPIESCLYNISYEEIKSNQKSIKKLEITNDSDEKTKIVTIDEQLIQIKIE